MAKAYFGDLANVQTTSIHGYPSSVSSPLEKEIMSPHTENYLRAMFTAFDNFRIRNYFDMRLYYLNRGVDDDSDDLFPDVSQSTRIQKAMECRDEKAFRKYREEAMSGLENILPREEVESVYEKDPERKHEEANEVRSGFEGMLISN